MALVFGPIPSRRLGSSLGINHIPPKNCSYACVYCQVGATSSMTIERRAFYPIQEIISEVDQKISASLKAGASIDYLTLVPDGEPTLDINLGRLIRELHKFSYPVAVISNGSLIDRADVQEELLEADWVSLKVDALQEKIWRKVNRPHGRLSLSSILAGMLVFRQKFQAALVTETLLVEGLNDGLGAIQALADFLLELQPLKSWLSIPIRPPVETWVKPPSPSVLWEILQTISAKISFLDILFDLEETDFRSTGNIRDDILSISAVHPIQEEALKNMLARAGADWAVVSDLISSNLIKKTLHFGKWFYTRRNPSTRQSQNRYL